MNRGTNRIRPHPFLKLVWQNAFKGPTSDVTDRERWVHLRFCEIMLASFDFGSPDLASRQQVLAAHWPIMSIIPTSRIADATEHRDCLSLVSWYDDSLPRVIASKAGVPGMSG